MMKNQRGCEKYPLKPVNYLLHHFHFGLICQDCEAISNNKQSSVERNELKLWVQRSVASERPQRDRVTQRPAHSTSGPGRSPQMESQLDIHTLRALGQNPPTAFTLVQGRGEGGQ